FTAGVKLGTTRSSRGSTCSRQAAERRWAPSRRAGRSAARAGRGFKESSRERNNMELSSRSAIGWKDIVPGAQTEGRGDAGRVGGLLGGKVPTGRFLFVRAKTTLASFLRARRAAS